MLSPKERVFLGFDPGGVGKFGVACIKGNELSCDVVDSAREALSWAEKTCRDCKPRAAGIDTLLHWSDEMGGWRPADRQLRAHHGPTVIAPAALRGAMVIGGMALALKLRDIWPEILLNETHPKALVLELDGPRFRDAREAALRWFEQTSSLSFPQGFGDDPSDHRFDAAISAWATREGLSQGWRNLAAAQQNLIFPAGSVRYLWPQQAMA